MLSGRIYATMSKHRKIFNLFKFIDEITYISKILSDTSIPIYLKTLELFSHLGSFFYFIFDNFLWLIYSNIRNFDPNPVNFFTKDQLKNFKYIKDLGSFWRLVFNLIINVLYIKRYSQKRKDLKTKLLFTNNQPLEKDSEAYKDLEQLLEARFELRSAWIEVIHSTVRTVMLWKSLKFLW